LQACKNVGDDVSIREEFVKKRFLGPSLNTLSLPNSVSHVLLAKWYMKSGGKNNESKALDHFAKASKLEPQLSELADYYRTVILVRRGVRDRQQTDVEHARLYLRRARLTMVDTIRRLSNYGLVIKQIKELEAKHGRGNATDYYSKQLDIKMKIYNTLVASTAESCGSVDCDLAQLNHTRIDEKTTQESVGEVAGVQRAFQSHGSGA
jgi:hypothetical protein